jgi:hypothetical protein
LILDASGNLAGTTYYGGSDFGGVVFKVDQKGHETLLHTFTGPDGYTPNAALIRDRAGNAYGTTSNGGTYGYGAVFELSPP